MNEVELARFWDKVDQTPTCWFWTGAKISTGYGEFYVSKIVVLAHRASYEHFVGPIPIGLELDHLCRVRDCVNPEHLEPVTRRENVLRGTGLTAKHARKTHCPRGHPYDEANTMTRPSKPNGRDCRTCHNNRRRKTKV